MTVAPGQGRRVAGLLLAAGAGTRLGTPKAVVEVGGRTLARRGVDLLERAGLDPIVVVVGASVDPVRMTLAGGPARIVVNPSWASGMASSLGTGLHALRDAADAAVVTLVDQPLIGVEAIRRLVTAWEAGAEAAVATYGGTRGHPVLLAASTWPDVVASARGDRGARAFLSAHPERVECVGCDTTGSPADIDTPDDLALVAARVGEDASCS